MRLLGGGVDHELAEARVPLGDDAAALEGAHGLTGGAQLARHRHGGLGLDRLEVHVGGGGEEKIVAPVLVDERRAGTTRGQHVGNDGQRLEVDLDFGGHVLCLGARGRGAERDQLADVAYLAGGQDRLHGRLEAGQRGVGADRRDAAEIFGDEHMVANGRRDRDALDARVRDRASEERHLQHAGQADVADILATAAHVAVVLLAQEPRADALGRRHPLRQSSGRPILARNATIGYRAPCIRSGRSRPTPTRWPKRSWSRATSAAGSGGRSREAMLALRCATLPVPNSTTSMPGSWRAKR